MAKADLATVENFKIVTGMEAMDEELRAELEDELDDLDDDGGIDAKHIKIPSGGGKAFEVETDDPDDPEVMKEVTGVIIFTHRMNAYWAQKFGEAGEDGNINKSPDCSSMDGKQGVNRETREIRTCDTCPYNQFGSDGKGKACKNMRRLYIMMDNRPDIYLLTVPPTSIKDVNKALKKIMGQQHIPYSRMIVTFKLNVVENADKIKYSKVTLEKTGLLPEALYKTTAELRKAMKQSYESVAITTDDYKEAAPMEATPEVGPDGFMQAGDWSSKKKLPAYHSNIGCHPINPPFTTVVKREKIPGIFPARLHKTKKCATIRLIFLSHEGIGRKCPKITNALEENEDGRACV